MVLPVKEGLKFQEQWEKDVPTRQYIMGKVTVRGTCIIVLTACNVSKRHESDETYNDKNKGKMKMVQWAGRQAQFRDRQILIIGVLNYKEFDRSHLELQVMRESWNHKFLK